MINCHIRVRVIYYIHFILMKNCANSLKMNIVQSFRDTNLQNMLSTIIRRKGDTRIKITYNKIVENIMRIACLMNIFPKKGVNYVNDYGKVSGPN